MSSQTDLPVTPSLREQKKEETRRALSRAAAELLLSEGNEGMTVAAIAERAGVSTRTFHNYFPRREDALQTFIEVTVDEFVHKIEEAPADEAPLWTLHRLIRERVNNDQDDGPDSPGTLLNLMDIGDHLSYVSGPEDRHRAIHLLDGLLEALYRRDSRTLTRQGTALLLVSALAAGAIAVEATRRGDGQNRGTGENGPTPSSDFLSDGTADVTTTLDESFALLEQGFGR